MLSICHRSHSAPSALELFSSETCWTEDAVKKDFIDSIDQILGVLQIPAHQDCIKELRRIQEEVQSYQPFNRYEKRKQLLLARSEVIDLLEKIPPEELRSLKPENPLKSLQFIWEAAFISSWIQNNPDSIGYREHQIVFKAFFERLVVLGEMNRANRIAEQFDASWPLWKRLTAKQSVLEGFIQGQIRPV